MFVRAGLKKFHLHSWIYATLTHIGYCVMNRRSVANLKHLPHHWMFCAWVGCNTLSCHKLNFSIFILFIKPILVPFHLTYRSTSFGNDYLLSNLIACTEVRKKEHLNMLLLTLKLNILAFSSTSFKCYGCLIQPVLNCDECDKVTV